MTKIYQLDENVAIYKQEGDPEVLTSGANKPHNVTVTDAGNILDVIDIKVSASPSTTVDQILGVSWAKNVVGMTLANVGAGTTVTISVTVIAL